MAPTAQRWTRSFSLVRNLNNSNHKSNQWFPMKFNVRYSHSHGSDKVKLSCDGRPLQQSRSKLTPPKLDGVLTIRKKAGHVKKNEVIGSIETEKVVIDIRADENGYISWNEGLTDGSSVDSQDCDALYSISSKKESDTQLSRQDADKKVINDFLNDSERENPVRVYNYATYCLKTGNVARAIDLFEELTTNTYPLHYYAKHGTNYWSWRYNVLYNHGTALRVNGNGETAIKIFLECAEIKRDNNVLCELGILNFTAIGNYGLSQEYFEEVIQDDPENYLAYYYLATIGRGQFDIKIDGNGIREQNKQICRCYENALKYSLDKTDDFWRIQIKEQYDQFQEQEQTRGTVDNNNVYVSYVPEPAIAMPYLGLKTNEKYFRVKNTCVRRFPNPKKVVPKYKLNDISTVRKIIDNAEEQSIVLLTGPGFNPNRLCCDYLYDANENDLLSLPFGPKRLWHHVRLYYEPKSSIAYNAQDDVLTNNHDPYQLLGRLYQDGKIASTITQDIDISGYTTLTHQNKDNITQLHGTIKQLVCETCGSIYDITLSNFNRLGSMDAPKCLCGNTLRPNIKMFHEFVDQQLTEKAREAIKTAKILLIVGADTGVTPVADLVKYALTRNLIQSIEKSTEKSVEKSTEKSVEKRPGKCIVIQIGGNKTYFTNSMDHFLEIDMKNSDALTDIFGKK